MKVFINDKGKEEQFCLLVDRQRFYKFCGKFALYTSGVVPEKIEYAQRLGRIVEIRQVYGFFTGECPVCGHMQEGNPILKKNNMYNTYCEDCEHEIKPSTMVALTDYISAL